MFIKIKFNTMKSVQFCFLLMILHVNLFNNFVSSESRWKNNLNRKIRSFVPDDVQAQTVKGLVKRLIPNHASSFSFEVNRTLAQNDKDVFTISRLSPSSNESVVVLIKASSGVAASWGLLYYLKYYCNSSVSWEANQINLPNPLPPVEVRVVARDRFRYYQNVCTVSYSFAWWQWPQWERHIDWMALNGINFPLAFTGQEAIWRRIYHKFNFTDDDLNEHFVGPAYLAWGRMGNIKQWQGPLSETWHNNTLALQHLILRRMRRFGMIPILPAFAGHVPPAIKRIYPDANVTRLSAWGKFTSDNYTRTYFLDPRDSLFKEIGVAFIKEMKREFKGTNHFYNCDTFNEMTPSDGTSSYLRRVGKAVLRAMISADTHAVWVMQGWIFTSEFWTYKRAKALLTAIPKGRMIILDLTSEASPQYNRLDSYFGHPFIFCLLQNFGGVDGFSGNINVLLKNIQAARNDPKNTMVGTGLTMEGINQNYVLFDFMLDLGYFKALPDVSRWAERYSVRRYGEESPSLKEAWKLLLNTVYNCPGSGGLTFHGKNTIIQHRPNFDRNTMPCYDVKNLMDVWSKFMSVIPNVPIRNSNNSQYFDDFDSAIANTSQSKIFSLLNDEEYNETLVNIADDYNSAEFLEEFIMKNTAENESNVVSNESNEDNYLFGRKMKLLKKVNESSLISKDTFRHDLVDITREVLQNIGGRYIDNLRISYLTQNERDFRLIGRSIVMLLKELDLLLGASKNFLLGPWLDDALSWASTEQEKKQYVSNALYQITLWGPNGEILDYAVKQWNGVVHDYMLPRWKLFIEVLTDCLENGKEFSQRDFDRLVFEKVEKPFAQGKTLKNWNYYSSKEIGDLIAIVKYLYRKYGH